MNIEIAMKLNPNGMNLDHIAGGGKTLIDREAVLWALGGGYDAEFHFAEFVVCGVEERRGAVKNWLFMAGIQLPEYVTFEKNNKHCLDALCQLVVDEYVDNRNCKPCKGSGFNKLLEPCLKCEGTGKHVNSLRYRAKRLNKNHRCWYQIEPMYQALFNVMGDWSYRVSLKLNERLR